MSIPHPQSVNVILLRFHHSLEERNIAIGSEYVSLCFTLSYGEDLNLPWTFCSSIWFMFDSSNRLKRKNRFNSVFARSHEWITWPLEKMAWHSSLIFSNRFECCVGSWSVSRSLCDVGVLDEVVQCFDVGFPVDRVIPIRWRWWLKLTAFVVLPHFPRLLSGGSLIHSPQWRGWCRRGVETFFCVL